MQGNVWSGNATDQSRARASKINCQQQCERVRVAVQSVGMSKEFKEHDLVWAKMRGYPAWPARVRSY